MRLMSFILLDSPADIGGSMDFSQSVGERLWQGVTTLLFGMAVVFSVLIILWAFLKLFKVIFYRKKKDKTADLPETEPAAPTEDTAGGRDEELVAVITAAVQMYLSEESGGAKPAAFRVVSFKKH